MKITHKIPKRFGIFFNDQLITLDNGKNTWNRKSDATLSWNNYVERLYNNCIKLHSYEQVHSVMKDNNLFTMYEYNFYHYLSLASRHWFLCRVLVNLSETTYDRFYFNKMIVVKEF